MSDAILVNKTTLRLMKTDITELDIECFVFQARPDLKLGSGFGTAISVRGGPTIQKELSDMAPLVTTEAAISTAGDLPAKWIIHAAGPTFQEAALEQKLATTIENVLKLADSRAVKKIAFPALGAGFYGIPLATSADVMVGTITEYLSQATTGLTEVVICLLDNRELKPFQERLGQPAAI